MRRVIRCAAALALLAFPVAVAGCGGDEQSAEAKVAFNAKSQSRPGGDPLGTTIRIGGDKETPPLEVTVMRLIDPVEGSPSDKLKQGERFFGVEYRLRNVGTLVYDDAPARGTELTMSNGRDAELATLSGDECADGLSYGLTLKPGKAKTICQPFVARRELVPRLMLFTAGTLTRTGEWKLH